MTITSHSRSTRNKPKTNVLMKKLLMLVLSLAYAATLQAATLATFPGTTSASSFSCSKSPMKTLSIAAQSSGTNLLTYNATNVTHGYSGSTNYLEVVVTRTVGGVWSSTYIPIGTGSTRIISVPTGQSYTISFSVMNCQTYSPTNYKSLTLGNIIVSN